LIKLIILFYLINYFIISQTFDFEKNYIDTPLIFSHETVLEGISKIVPVGGDFSKFSKIELSKVKKDVLEPSTWLKDKMYSETGDIAKLERILRSKDSPLSDPIFDQFKHLPIYIDNTLELLANNPLTFCNEIYKQYNKTGVLFDLSCTIPFGFFNKYLTLRLQYHNMIWYYTNIGSLNFYRYKELLSIAETFDIKK
tara:strand:- start:807 stop:1397 length:591 start_codon:yes stop_codon:yes gene_type:complete